MTPEMTQPRAGVLCVDDEPQVLEGLKLHLGRRYDFRTAGSGAAGLEVLAAERGIAVVISDMRMPKMDGAAFLAKAREVAPDAVRMLLTGQTDLDSAIAAVNEGQIFRFMTKPVAPASLLRAVEAAVDQQRLITAERVLLERTLLGSMKALADVLALTSPTAFGRSSRIKELVSALAEKLEVTPRWQLEMAATLSQLGCVSLPQPILEKLYRGAELTAEESAMAARSAALTVQLLGSIPRLEVVLAMLASFAKPAPARFNPPTSTDATQRLVAQATGLFRLAVDFDTLESAGKSADDALEIVRSRASRYDPGALEALAGLRGGNGQRDPIMEVGVGRLRAGMVFLEDVKLRNGMLFVARGYQVTPGFLERIRNHAGNLQEPLRVVVRPEPKPAAG